MCPACNGPKSPGDMACDNCQKVLYPDWQIELVKTRRGRGIDGSDYRGFVQQRGQWREIGKAKRK